MPCMNGLRICGAKRLRLLLFSWSLQTLQHTHTHTRARDSGIGISRVLSSNKVHTLHYTCTIVYPCLWMAEREKSEIQFLAQLFDYVLAPFWIYLRHENWSVTHMVLACKQRSELALYLSHTSVVYSGFIPQIVGVFQRLCEMWIEIGLWGKFWFSWILTVFFSSLLCIEATKTIYETWNNENWFWSDNFSYEWDGWSISLAIFIDTIWSLNVSFEMCV